MRIIAGAARGRRLASLKGLQTRPTADRVREAMFSLLFSRMGSFADKTVLDMFAGSGALALEALSRGAARAWLVEKSANALQTIEKNLLSCRYSDHAEIIRRDLWRVLPALQAAGPFDLVFSDPPYGEGLAERALQAIVSHGLLTPGGLACIETGADEVLPDHLETLVRVERRRYGSTALHLYHLEQQDTP